MADDARLKFRTIRDSRLIEPSAGVLNLYLRLFSPNNQRR